MTGWRVVLDPRGLVVLAVALLAVLGLPALEGGADSRSTALAGAPDVPVTGEAGAPLDERARVASPFMRRSGQVILGILAVAQLLAVIRLLKGPTLADRVIALDFIGITCAAMIGVYSITAEEPMFLRAAIVLALVSFLGTIGFALYCEKRGVP